MSRTLAVAAAIVVTLGSSLWQSSPASAERVAWNLSIGGPGYAINVGAPGPWGGPVGFRGPRHPGVWRPWIGPGYAPLLPAPVLVPAWPITVSAGFPAPAFPAAPFAVAPPRPVTIYVPRRVVFPAPLLVVPRHHGHRRH